MAKSIHEMSHVHQPDFIPEGDEWKYPQKGGVFCDFIPEGMTAVEFHPTPDGTPKVQLVPIEEPVVEEPVVEEPVVEEPVTPNVEENKSGTKSRRL